MLHILLCDDDAIFTETLKRLIEAQPEFNRRYMQIECVHDPHALKKAAVQKADMIFLDIDMGDVNGIALARQMRTIRKDAVLIFVTNYGEYAAEGYEVSAFRFLPKLQLAEKTAGLFSAGVGRLPQPNPHAECSVRRRGHEHRARRVGLCRNCGTDADFPSCGTGGTAE